MSATPALPAGLAATQVYGIGLPLALYKLTSSVGAFSPGLLTMGLGIGLMLTPSVNVVQSRFPNEEQGEISVLSRAVSNLGSSLGTAIAGTIVVADASAGNTSYVIAMVVLAAIALLGLAVSFFIPSEPSPRRQ